MEPTGKKGEKGEGFDVLKSGDARVAMIGFPSVGKVNYFACLSVMYIRAKACQLFQLKYRQNLNAREVKKWDFFIQLSS